MLNFQEFQNTNAERMKRWHKDGDREWSGLEWAGAMCGEAGECANVAKKILRVELNLAGNAFSEHKMIDVADMIEKLGCEIGDVIIYASLLASKYNLSLEECVRMSFNNKSIEAGFPERI